MNNSKMLIAFLPILFLTAACGGVSSSILESSITASSSSSVSSETSSELSSIETLRTITTEAQLAAIADDLDFAYELGADITISGAWTPIGTQANSFTGSFNGNGHSITGLSLSAESIVYEPVQELVADVVVLKGVGYLGLFGVNGGTIENVNIDDVSITGTATFNGAFSPDEIRVHAGALAAINAGTIRHVSTSGTFSLSTADGRLRAGGLVGLNYGGTIQYCESSVSITATASLNKVASGGLVGESEGVIALLSYVKATGNVSSTFDGDASLDMNAYAGGLVGFIQGGNIADAFASGNASSVGSGAGPVYAGGLIGNFSNEYSSITVTNVYASGTASATATASGVNSYAGGLCGRYDDKNATNELSEFVTEYSVTILNVLTSSNVLALAAKKGNAGQIIGKNVSTHFNLANAYYTGEITTSNSPNVIGTQTTLNDITVSMMGWPEYWTIAAGVVSLSMPILSLV